MKIPILSSYSQNVRVRFPNDVAMALTHFQANISIEAVGDMSSVTNLEYSSIGFFGFFYNADTTPPSQDPTGDVYFILRFGDRGAGLEAWWYLGKTLDANYNDSLLDSGTIDPPTGGWLVNTNYPLDVQYDGINSFTAKLGSQTTATILGPGKIGEVHSSIAFIRSRIRHLQSFTGDVDANVFHATIDDVVINIGSGLVNHDEFDAVDEALSTTKWRDDSLVRQSTVMNSMLKVSLKGASTDAATPPDIQNRVQLPYEYYGTNVLQADFQIDANTVSDSSRNHLDIFGIWGNGKYSVEDNSPDGGISLEARLEKMANSPNYRVICSSSMTDNPSNSAWVDIFWETAPALPDTMYTAYLEKRGNMLTCNIKNTLTNEVLVSVEKDATTVLGVGPIAPIGLYKRLGVRNRYYPAEVSGYFDNVYVDSINIVPITSLLLLN